MNIKETKKEKAYVLHIEGRLDSNTSNVFEERVMNILHNGEKNILIDFSKVDYISSAGLRVVLMAAKKTMPAGGKVVLFSLSDNVKEVFDMAGFSSIFSIYENQEEALKAF